ncbi:MAG: PilZ domain-containing protein [Candidatus Omnitrophica bacterium]|nr:PilZ domain-containing protein [Candidatus Omnitrophota bacterium]
MGTIEHRKLFRAEAFARILYETVQEPHISGKAVTVNISSIGAHMISTHLFPAGTQLHIKLFIEGQKTPISALAKAVWQKECVYQPDKKKRYYATGIMFEDMSLEDAILTSDYIFDIATKRQFFCEKKIIRKLQGKR